MPNAIDVIILNHPEGNPSGSILAAALKVLTPKARLLAINVGHIEELKTALLFAGFVNVIQLEDCGKFVFI